MTSTEPHPDKCGAQCRNGEYCENYPVEGADRCRMHGGQTPRGPDSPNYKHGAFSDHLRSDLTDGELEAIEDMVGAFEDAEHAREMIAEQAAEAWLKYKRSADTRFLREYRQLAETFNLAPNEDTVNVREFDPGASTFIDSNEQDSDDD